VAARLRKDLPAPPPLVKDPVLPIPRELGAVPGTEPGPCRAARPSSGTFRREPRGPAAPREEIAVKTRDLAYIALFAAITAVLGLLPPVPVPGLPVPITAQTLGVMLAGSVLGAKRGGLALLVFLAVVALGAPVLAGGRGGLSVFFGPTAGYLYSWPIAAFVIGWLTQLFWRRYNLAWALVANLLGGIVVIYAIGIPFTSLYGDIPLTASATGSLAFIPGDVVKAVAASVVAVAVRRAYPVIELPTRHATAG
jgi:biotin transport system substrate-specific component